ncbi:hypothetical protein ACWGAN_30325 [Streptomyces sp. NPDC054945]
MKPGEQAAGIAPAGASGDPQQVADPLAAIVQHPVDNEYLAADEERDGEVFFSRSEFLEQGVYLADSGFGIRLGYAQSQTHSQRAGTPIAGAHGQFGEDLLRVPSGAKHRAGVQK